MRRQAWLLVILIAPMLGASSAPAQTAPAVAVVRLPFPQEDGSLTPYTFELGYPLVTLIYDTLLWRDPQGTPRPWLADKFEVSSDGRRITLNLAHGVSFHDGVALTSADVAFTFAYVATHPHPRFTPAVEAVERVEIPDAATAVIVLRHPSLGFIDQPLADLPILPAHLWRPLPPSKLTPEGPPIGSGPYRLVAHEPGARYRFEANEGYFKGRPTVSAIEVPIVADADATMDALRRGDLDVLPTHLPPGEAPKLEGFLTGVISGQSYEGLALLFNVRRPPFDDAELRRAIADAIDLRQIAGDVRVATPATRGLVHPDSPWAPQQTLDRFDPDAAEASFMRLEPGVIRIAVPDNDPAALDAARRVEVALERAGAEPHLDLLSRDDFIHVIGEDRSTPSFDAAIGSIPALASYDPDFVRRMFGTDGSINYSGYRSRKFDAAADQVASAPDAATRKTAIADMLETLAADAPVVPLYFPVANYAFRPQVYRGWIFVKGTGIFDKQSFLPRTPTAVAPASKAPLVRDGSPRTMPIRVVGASIGVLIVVIGAAWWWRR